MAATTQTVLAQPYTPNLGTTNPGNIATTNVAPGPGVDPVSGLVTGGLSLATANSEYDLSKEIFGQATQGTNTALQQLAAFISDPSSVTKMPGYQFGMDQGMTAVNRGAGASGLLNSGNRLTALQDFGQNYAGTWMDRMFKQLMGNVDANVQGGSLALNAGRTELGALADRNQAITGGAAGILSSLFGNNNIFNSPFWQQIMRAIGGGSGGSGGYPIGSPQNPSPQPGDPTPGGGGTVGGSPIGGPGDPGGPMDPGVGIDPFTPVPMPDIGIDPGSIFGDGSIFGGP